MLRVGLTGGIGSGKSLVASIFSRLKIPVFYADAEAATITNTHPTVLNSLREKFGEEVITADHKLNRPVLREIIFNDIDARSVVNALVHPLVKSRFEAWCLEQHDVPFILKEAAILFEAGAHRGLDKVIIVTAPEQLRIERVMKRDGVDEAQVQSIISSQLSDEEKMERADFIIENDGMQLIVPQVLTIYKKLTGKVP